MPPSPLLLLLILLLLKRLLLNWLLPSCCRLWSQLKATHGWLKVVMVKPCWCVEGHPCHSHGRAHG